MTVGGFTVKERSQDRSRKPLAKGQFATARVAATRDPVRRRQVGTRRGGSDRARLVLGPRSSSLTVAHVSLPRLQIFCSSPPLQSSRLPAAGRSRVAPAGLPARCDVLPPAVPVGGQHPPAADVEWAGQALGAARSANTTHTQHNNASGHETASARTSGNGYVDALSLWAPAATPDYSRFPHSILLSLSLFLSLVPCVRSPLPQASTVRRRPAVR